MNQIWKVRLSALLAIFAVLVTLGFVSLEANAFLGWAELSISYRVNALHTDPIPLSLAERAWNANYLRNQVTALNRYILPFAFLLTLPFFITSCRSEPLWRNALKSFLVAIVVGIFTCAVAEYAAREIYKWVSIK